MRTVLTTGLAAGAAGAALGGLLTRRRGGGRRTDDLVLAHTIAREVGGLVDPAAVYRTAVRMLAARLREEGVGILEVRERELVPVASAGLLAIEAGYVQRRHEGLLGLAVRTGAPWSATTSSPTPVRWSPPGWNGSGPRSSSLCATATGSSARSST